MTSLDDLATCPSEPVLGGGAEVGRERVFTVASGCPAVWTVAAGCSAAQTFATDGLCWSRFAEIGHAASHNLVPPAPPVFGGLLGGVERRPLPERLRTDDATMRLNARVPCRLTSGLTTGNHNRISDALDVAPALWREVEVQGTRDRPSAVSYTLTEPTPMPGSTTPRPWRVRVQIDGYGENQRVRYCAVTEIDSDIDVEAGHPRAPAALAEAPTLGDEAVHWLCNDTEHGPGLDRYAVDAIAVCMASRDPVGFYEARITSRGHFDVRYEGWIDPGAGRERETWHVRLRLVPDQGRWAVGAVEYTRPGERLSRYLVNPAVAEVAYDDLFASAFASSAASLSQRSRASTL